MKMKITNLIRTLEDVHGLVLVLFIAAQLF